MAEMMGECDVMVGGDSGYGQWLVARGGWKAREKGGVEVFFFIRRERLLSYALIVV